MEIAIHNVKSVYLKDIHTYEKDNHYMNSFTYTEAKDVRFEVESLIWFQNRRVILNYMLRRYE